jgi:crotonobetainyl-CoA:carnitine CoA-transferase CaiB-like acyl-CoA transferase
MAKSGLPLEGIRVLDLTQAWAGPMATKTLADLGAEVIKIEAPGHHDFIRDFFDKDTAPPRPYNASGYFNEINRNKLGVAIEFTRPEGRELVLALAEHCDVMIDNSRPGVLKTLGLDESAVRRRNPNMIIASMPGYGGRGPQSDYPVYGPAMEHTAGLTSFTGYLDSTPQKTGISYGDPVGGISTASAIIAAILYRRRTGKGVTIDVSQREALEALIGEALVSYSLYGREPRRQGNRNASMSPHGVFPTLGRAAGADHWIAIAVRSDEEFARLARLMGDPPWAREFNTLAERKRREDELEEHIAQWTIRFERYELMHRLQAERIAAGVVLSPRDLLSDPHFKARNFYPLIDHPDHGRQPVSAPVFRASETPTGIRRPAPCFGQHTREVLGRLLGLSDAQIEDLRGKGIIADVPSVYRG